MGLTTTWPPGLRQPLVITRCSAPRATRVQATQHERCRFRVTVRQEPGEVPSEGHKVRWDSAGWVGCVCCRVGAVGCTLQSHQRSTPSGVQVMLAAVAVTHRVQA